MDNKVQEMLAKKFSIRFEEYNTNVLTEIAKVIKQFKGLSYTQAHKLAQQLKFDKSYTDLIDELAKLSGKSKKEIKAMLEEVARQDIEFADTFYKAKELNTPIYESSKTLQNIVNGVVNMSNDDFVNIAKSTGFRLLDSKGKPVYLDIKEAYYKVIDECVYAVQTGQDTYDNTMRSTIKQLANSGVRKIEYRNEGKEVYSQRIDTAVRRNVLDSIRQTTIEINEELGKEFDADGVEVTVHSNPAPDHMYVQGHQFSNEEFEKFQSDQDCEDVNGVKYPATSAETGVDRRSIGEYNCYHTTFPILVGISRPLYSDEQLQKIIEDTNAEVEIDGKKYNKYEVTQLQRQLETEIRKSKDAHIMYKGTGDTTGMLREQKRITQLTRKYKEISKKAELREQLNRASVSGYKRVSVKQLQTPVAKTNYKEVSDKLEQKMNEKSQNIFTNLPNDQDSALRRYATKGSDEINETLVYGEPKNGYEVYDNVYAIKKDIKNIDKIMEQNQIEDNILLYRGTSNDILENYEAGETFSIPVFNSTSTKIDVAEKFALKQSFSGKEKAILEIKTPKGTNGIYLGNNYLLADEHEVLLDRNLEYKLISKEVIDPSGYENGVYVHKVKYTKYILEVVK